MAFWGFDFLLDNVSSTGYGIYISSIGDSGVIDGPFGSSINLITKKLLRNPVEYFYGAEQAPVLDFEISVTSPEPLSGSMRNVIGSWLFGKQSYRKLRIMQNDLQDVYFNCFIVSGTAIYIGNLCYGFKIHIKCDSPFAYGNPAIVLKTYSTVVNESYTYNNLSANAYYTYPVLGFRMSAYGGDFSITNTSDSNRVFSFTGLAAVETINMDCQRQVLTSNTGLLRISNFNKKWLRFIPGINILTIVGNIDYLALTIPVVKKVGA
jgi:phage-related protein